jgi:hypothetical protein
METRHNLNLNGQKAVISNARNAFFEGGEYNPPASPVFHRSEQHRGCPHCTQETLEYQYDFFQSQAFFVCKWCGWQGSREDTIVWYLDSHAQQRHNLIHGETQNKELNNG